MPEPAILNELGEFFAAGFSELPAALPIIRYARAYRRWFEKRPLENYEGGRLYPCGIKGDALPAILSPSYSFTHVWDDAVFDAKLDRAGSEEQRTLRALRGLVQTEERKVKRLVTPHTIGGNGYTHAIVNYGRVITEGLDSYVHRIEMGLETALEEPTRDLYQAMIDLVAGIRVWHSRLVLQIQGSDRQSERSATLLEALARVPFGPARSFYEAIVAYNLIYYIDGCDNPGRLDQVLWPHYERDSAVGYDQALALMCAFYDNVQANRGYSVAIGGTHADGTPAYNALTEICIDASHHRFRPSVELRVRDDMPDRLWQISLDALATGCGQPALYNEAGYLDALRSAELGIRDRDIVKWNGGGCTETMLHGCSNVGSLDAGFNLALILEGSLQSTLGRDIIGFAEIVAAFKKDVVAVVDDVVSQLNAYHAARAKHRPQPVRTLLMDDCIDQGREFNAGGARYNWSVVNVAGLANVADSLEAVRDLIFERQQLTPSALLRVLETNFEGHEPLRQQLLACAKFGNDLSSVDSLAAEIAEFVYCEILSRECKRGGKFLPSHIMFETFDIAGRQVGATPDGRLAGQPLADSIGPVQGRDGNGPTALLKSAASLPQHLVAGTPVLNLRFSKAMFRSAGAPKKLRALIETYFKMGGLQVQISVLDRKELLAAMERPHDHENLIVRIGGYSTRFNWLSDALKLEVIKRTEYAL